jgi:N-acetylmuramic acid 6-phosphate etherase
MMFKKIFIVTALVLQPASIFSQNLSVTEHSNPKSANLDGMSAFEITRLMNSQDAQIIPAVAECLPVISRAIEAIADRIRSGGRLIYIGAGTSGRLAVLDASECIPTFSAPEGQIVGIIAGGDTALRKAIEAIEDNGPLGVQDLKQINITNKDVVCGVSASGMASYVFDGLTYAKECGCVTIAVTCNPENKMKDLVDYFIAPEVGPEIIAGSTRLKAGTATKMVLNMLTTGSYILLGKVYKNFMIDVRPINKKLVNRAQRILQAVLDIDQPKAESLLLASNNNIKVAVLMHTFGWDYETAAAHLNNHPNTSLTHLIEHE